MPFNHHADETVLWKNVRVWTGETFSKNTDLLVINGEISDIGSDIDVAGGQVHDGNGAMVLPGLVDLKTQVGAGRHEEREIVQTALNAAAAGGFTHVVAAPNTDPPITNEDALSALISRSHQAFVRVLPAASLTTDSHSLQLTDMVHLREAGAAAFAPIFPVNDGGFLRRVLQYTRMLDVPLFIWAEDTDLAGRGQVNESSLSQRMGLQGKHAVAESIGISKALLVLEAFGGPLHVQSVSTEQSADLVRDAKNRGLAVTAQCNYLNLILTEEAIADFDPSAKVDPPLRSELDRDSLIQGIRSGVIDCIVTDHTPLTREENDVEFEAALVGAAGLETALSALYTELVVPGKLEWAHLIAAMSDNPRRIMGIPESRLEKGNTADFTVFDPDITWTVDTVQWRSKGVNSPFQGRQLTGRVRGIMRGANFVDTTVCR